MRNTKVPTSLGYSTELGNDRQMFVQRTNCASLEPHQNSILGYILYWHIFVSEIVMILGQYFRTQFICGAAMMFLVHLKL